MYTEQNQPRKFYKYETKVKGKKFSEYGKPTKCKIYQCIY